MEQVSLTIEGSNKTKRKDYTTPSWLITDLDPNALFKNPIFMAETLQLGLLCGGLLKHQFCLGALHSYFL